MGLHTIPDGRADEADEYIDRLLDQLPPETWEMAEPTLEDGGTVEVTAGVGDARVVITLSEDSPFGNDAVVEFDRYLQSPGNVSNLEIVLRP